MQVSEMFKLCPRRLASRRALAHAYARPIGEKQMSVRHDHVAGVETGFNHRLSAEQT
jgi:hypothetical protein